MNQQTTPIDAHKLADHPNIIKRFAKFLLDNAVGIKLYNEFDLRIIDILTDGDYSEYIVIQARPLGRDGETLFYRVSVLYDDLILQCDYAGNLLSPEPSSQRIPLAQQSGLHWRKCKDRMPVENDYPVCLKGDGGGAPFYTQANGQEDIEREIRRASFLYDVEWLESTPAESVKEVAVAFYKWISLTNTLEFKDENEAFDYWYEKLYNK